MLEVASSNRLLSLASDEYLQCQILTVLQDVVDAFRRGNASVDELPERVPNAASARSDSVSPSKFETEYY
jgi:hypothetical protein